MSGTALCSRCWGSKLEPSLFFKKTCVYCNGDGTISDPPLSLHFTTNELTRSDLALRKKIPNNPDDVVKINLSILANKLLEPIRLQFGALNINSGYRSLELNSALGGSSKTSAHILGCAADFVPANKAIKLKDVVNWIVLNKKALGYDQVIYESSWVHVGIKHMLSECRQEALSMFAGKYYPWDDKDPRVI